MILSQQIRRIKTLNRIMENSEFGVKEEPYKIFARSHGIDPDDLSYLGRGDFGEAYATSDGRVIKQTSSKSEGEIAKELLGKTNFSFAKIYDVQSFDYYICILMEEVDTDSKIEELYYELNDLLEQQGLPMQYLDHLDTDEFEISDELQEFINGVSNINHSYRMLGIEASDLRPENMGYNKEGELVAFDIEDRQKNH